MAGPTRRRGKSQTAKALALPHRPALLEGAGCGPPSLLHATLARPQARSTTFCTSLTLPSHRSRILASRRTRALGSHLRGRRTDAAGSPSSLGNTRQQRGPQLTQQAGGIMVSFSGVAISIPSSIDLPLARMQRLPRRQAFLLVGGNRKVWRFVRTCGVGKPGPVKGCFRLRRLLGAIAYELHHEAQLVLAQERFDRADDPGLAVDF
jgi:hypothetical protein